MSILNVMAVMSRVLWSACLQNTAADAALLSARKAVAGWALGDPESPLEQGRIETTSPKGLDRSVEVLNTSDPLGFLVDVEDQDSDATWGVTIRIAVLDDRLTCWVDNTMESARIARSVELGRPKVVDSLLQIGQRPRLGSSALLTAVQDIATAGVPVLVEHLQDEKRMLPVVVVTCPRSGFNEHTSRRSEAMTRRLTGMATVVRLDPDAQDALRAALPDRAGVWGGAMRVYAPGRIESVAGHRVFTSDLLALRSTDPVINWVTSMSARRRPDLRLRAMDGQRTTGTQDLAGEVATLRATIEDLETQLGMEQLERADAETQLSEAVGQLRRLRELGFSLGRAADVVAATSPGDDDPDDAVNSVEDAVIQAQLSLTDHLVIPESAVRDIDRLDATPNAAAWGNTVWRGLQALADYAKEASAEEADTKGFWNWCAEGGRLWPATTKKLAMRESETVASNAKWKAARVFDVDEKTDRSGKLYMEAHLKISEGGGDLAPRVYFHDDAKGATGKVHVGFIGPHYLVPNTKS